MRNEDIIEGSPPAQPFPAMASPVNPLNDETTPWVPDFFFLLGEPDLESPDSLLSRKRNLSISDYNVTPDFQASRCISPLSLATAVSPKNDYPTMFKQDFFQERKIILFLSNQNKGFQEIRRGSKDKAKQILVDGLGYTEEFFKKLYQGIPSPSDSKTQNIHLMVP
jgi:hypothetical protein